MTPRTEPSRRDFLAASAAGLLHFVGPRGTGYKQLRSAGGTFFVGTYTEGSDGDGIHIVAIDPATGALELIDSVNAGENPSFLAIHPNGRTLYVANETLVRGEKKSGAVSAFAIAPDARSLSRINERDSEGGAPCYVSVDRDGRAVLVANYVGGNVALLPIGADGALGRARSVVQHRGAGPNAERQDGPHAHCILADPANRFVLAADLGVDRVFVYRLRLTDGALEHVAGGEAILKPGAGPRHLVFHPGLPLVFAANELDSTVTALRYDGERGALTVLQTHSTLPAGQTGTNYPADIHVAPNGRALYVSNRGHNSIAMFSVGAAGALALEQVVSTEGDWPRNFTIDPTGRWLLVANQRSGTIVVYARDEQTGRLTLTQHRLAVPRPVCLRFFSSHDS